MISRRLALLAPLALVAPALAQNPGGDPSAPIARLDAALLQVMRMGQATPFAQRYAVLAPAVQAAFDLPAILAASVGFGWHSFSPQQQQALLAVFTRYTVASYAANFDSYTGQRIELLPQQGRQTGQDMVVATQIAPANGGAPTRLDYVMRRTPQGWKAVDVLAEGTSNVTTQRSDFRGLVVGNNPDPLIASLTQKVNTLSGGASLP
jgi:phospholipid transport system substrate-binding protein